MMVMMAVMTCVEARVLPPALRASSWTSQLNQKPGRAFKSETSTLVAQFSGSIRIHSHSLTGRLAAEMRNLCFICVFINERIFFLTRLE